MSAGAQPERLASAYPTTSLFKKPRRITITLPEKAYQALISRSLEEGRSISNLAAFLLERSLLP